MGFSFFKSKKSEKQKLDPEVAAGLKGERSSNPQISIKLAEHFLRENKRELAVDEYLHAAQSFLEKRQAQLAMAVYRNIITIDPERYSVYETLADLYRKSGFPGDGASVLLALAYQYKTAGCDSEVKRVLDSVLEFAPNNPILKRKVQAFFATEGSSGNAAEQPVAPAPPTAPSKSDSAAPEQKSVSAQPREPDHRPEVPLQPPASAAPDAPESPTRPFFDLQSARVTDAALGQKSDSAQSDESAAKPGVPVQLSKSAREPDIFAPQPVDPVEPSEPAAEPVVASGQESAPDSPTRPFFDLQSALETDTASGQKSVSAQSDESAVQPDVPVQLSKSAREPDIVARQPVDPASPGEPAAEPVVAAGHKRAPDVTAQSFFDLQAALATDASLGFDYDSSSENTATTDQESSPFSILNVVKDIALQDPRQDTPLFHLNLGIAYMQCGDYELAVDELLNALYGIPDKIGCYVRLAECSLKLQRRELACGFLREALDDPGIGQNQAGDVRKRLDEISAG